MELKCKICGDIKNTLIRCDECGLAMCKKCKTEIDGKSLCDYCGTEDLVCSSCGLMMESAILMTCCAQCGRTVCVECVGYGGDSIEICVDCTISNIGGTL